MAADHSETEILVFARRWIGSIWCLELLVLLKRDPARNWTAEELVQEMRASPAVVADSIRDLMAAGLVGTAMPALYSFAPQSNELAEIAGRLTEIYLEKPRLVIKELLSAPNDKIQTFADAFRFKK